MFKQEGKCIIIPNNARKTIALYSNDGNFPESVLKFKKKKLLLKFFPYIFIDFINYLDWFTKKNNKDIFLQKS